MLEREKEVVVKERKLFVNILSWVIAFVLCGIIYGFWVWRRDIEPMVDSQNKAQLEFLQLQVEKLRLEN